MFIGLFKKGLIRLRSVDNYQTTKINKMEKIYLNYQELSFIMDISQKESKSIFLKILNIEKVTTKDLIDVDNLKSSFKNIVSLDHRYDGQNSLIFNIEHKKQLYKKFLNEKAFIKNQKLSGGKSIFYKILPSEDLELIKSNLKYKHDYIYKNKNN